MDKRLYMKSRIKYPFSAISRKFSYGYFGHSSYNIRFHKKFSRWPTDKSDLFLLCTVGQIIDTSNNGYYDHFSLYVRSFCLNQLRIFTFTVSTTWIRSHTISLILCDTFISLYISKDRSFLRWHIRHQRIFGPLIFKILTLFREIKKSIYIESYSRLSLVRSFTHLYFL